MAKKVLFWIFFPIISILISGLLVFYLDLANGPLILFIAEVIILSLAIITRIILRGKKFIIRVIPLLVVVVTNAIILPLAKPSIEVKSAAYYANPIKTETLSLKDGDIVGVYNEDKSVQIYAGIPYAQAPVGELRWKEPQDAIPWEGVKDCTHFAARSMQPADNDVTSTIADIYASKAWHPDWNMHSLQNMSEDSLYLNIWRPNNDKSSLPILVFIHGGSLTSGSSAFEDYNGEEMAKKDVIMITIQYRLNVFGYFAHEDLANESSNHTTGNYGLLDQIKALKWINENATYFGGDKNNITVSGESAGSSSVSALCTSPLAKGLFKRAIGESSSLVMSVPPHTYRQMDDALETGEQIMKEFNCSSIEELRKIPAEQLVKTSFSNSSMTLDGYALTKNPYEVYQDHENNEEALLNGYNVLEADAFVIPIYLLSPTNAGNIKERLVTYFGEDVGVKLYNLYEDKIKVDAFGAFNEIISVYWFISPHHFWSNMALNNGVTVYRYQFTKENGYHGTFHSGEMIYAYGNVKRSPYGYRYNDSDRNLSEKMLSYWANFAKTGNPNQLGLENWPTYNNDHDQVMELGEHVGTIEDKYLDVYPLIQEFMDEQKNTK